MLSPKKQRASGTQKSAGLLLVCRAEIQKRESLAAHRKRGHYYSEKSTDAVRESKNQEGNRVSKNRHVSTAQKPVGKLCLEKPIEGGRKHEKSKIGPGKAEEARRKQGESKLRREVGRKESVPADRRVSALPRIRSASRSYRRESRGPLERRTFGVILSGKLARRKGSCRGTVWKKGHKGKRGAVLRSRSPYR